MEQIYSTIFAAIKITLLFHNKLLPTRYLIGFLFFLLLLLPKHQHEYIYDLLYYIIVCSYTIYNEYIYQAAYLKHFIRKLSLGFNYTYVKPAFLPVFSCLHIAT